ncbi:Uma2 family endonuclease [Nonomuraea sp. NBC_01738]|uniref:Uma2 family endonuclease n=1 Tax=Nonomuraea sp. NBC_01738 TaxID=2976003 RepID=UPI002E16482A|nr:Uma2 family endonuclease [Nonomuraea sp. NBC_01738]
MATLPGEDWFADLRPQPRLMTADIYEGLDEDVATSIEVVDGYVVYCESPSREHQRAARRLANLIEQHSRDYSRRTGECLSVDLDVDLRLRDLPLSNRRPDVVLYRCLEANEKLRPTHTLLVIEIVSPGSETADTADKLAEYAKAGIPHYWIVWIAPDGITTVERYTLDRATGSYKHVSTLMNEEEGDLPSVLNPIPMTIDWEELAF